MLFGIVVVFFIFTFTHETTGVVQSKSYRFFSDQQAFSTFDVEAIAPEAMSFLVPEGNQCDESENCVAGECRLNKTSGLKSCQCSDGSFRYWMEVPGLYVCLKCRQLGSTCSLNEECDCTDTNAMCYGAVGTRKGHCQCRWSLDIGNSSTCPGSPQEQCTSTLDCLTSVRFLDASGHSVFTPVDGLTCAPNNSSSMLLSWESELLSDAATVSPEPRLVNRTTKHGCQCPPGFLPSANDSYACQDVDECDDSRGNPCMPQSMENAEVTCINTLGSYRCECHSGYAIAQGLPPHGICCKLGHVPCLDSSKCIPMFKLCNGVPECTHDCSDELYPFCNFNSNRPFPDFLQYPQCHEAFSDNSEDVTIGETTITVSSAPNNDSTTMELLPLGSSVSNETETPPRNIPTLPSNVTPARLLGYVLI